MKRLILILLFPLSLMAQDTIRFVGSKANGSASGEWKFLIIGQGVSAISGNDTIPFPSGGSADSSIFATIYQLGLKANLGEMNTALSGKAATSHGHAQSEITDLVTALSGKAASSHGHAISEVTNLQTSLDAKLATTAVKQGAYLSDTTKFPLTSALKQGAYLSDTTKFPLTSSLKQGAYLSDTTKFALTSHTQAQSTVTGLTDSITAKPTRTELTTQLATKAASTHGHAQSEVTALTDSIAAKPTRGELTTQLATKANTSHTQAISTVIALQDSLNAKLNRSEYTPGGSPDTTILASKSYVQNEFTPKTRSISAGTGLSGGGTMYADRTISADTATVLTSKSYTTNALQWKQNTISNLADTSKYYETHDTTTVLAGKSFTNNALQWKETLANKNAASGYAGLTASTKLTASQGQEVWSISDLTTYATTSGTGTQAILSTITAPATNQVLAWNGTNWVNQNDATGSGLSNYVSVKRTADTSTSLATPLQIGGMAFSVTSGVYYSYRYVLLYQTGLTTTGIKLSLTFPAVTTQSARVTISGQTSDGATTEPWCGTINSSGDIVTSSGVAVANVNYVATIEGNILPSATGDLVLKWSSETTAAATLKQGSIGYMWSF